MSTSCAAESAFSIAGYIDRKSRARLSSKILRFSILSKEEEKINNIKQELYENWKKKIHTKTHLINKNYWKKKCFVLH